MDTDFTTWLSQIPWSSVGILAVLVAFFLWNSLRKRGSRARLLAKIVAGALVVDVRSRGEFEGGHYDGAINLPVDTLAKQTKRIGALDRPVIVYCASGGRSSQAAAILRGAGFTDVTNAGGLAHMPR